MAGSRTRGGVGAFLAYLLVLVSLIVGCEGEPTADLLTLVDVAPRHLEVGDTVEVLGTSLPSGNVQHATLVFRGTLHRAGAAPVAIDHTLHGARPNPDRVSFTFSEELQRIFCGSGDEAAHTTFAGDVVVRYPAIAEGGVGVQGTLRGVTLDFRAPPVRRSLENDRIERGERAAAFFGLTLDGSDRQGEGMRVRAVAEDSPAARAGLETGDLLLRFDGVTVIDPSDLVPRRGERTAESLIRRGDEELLRSLEIAGFEAEALPDEVLAGLVLLGILGCFLLIMASPAAAGLAWVERRLLLRVAGPRRNSGRIATLRSALWSLVHAGKRAGLAPYLVFAVVTTSFAVMPLGRRLLSAELDVGILYVIALSSLVAIGLITGGARWTPLSALRSAAQLLASQLPALTAVVCVLVAAGSLRMQDVIAAQAGAGESWLGQGGWPWFWNVFRQPGNLILCGLFFTTATLEGQRDELPGAEGRGSGRTSVRALLFLFADWLHVFVCCGLATALFLGGWLVPGVSAVDLAASFGWQLVGTVLFLLKAWTLVLAAIAARRTLPRLRPEQLMRVAWRWLVPLAALGAGLSALWIAGTQPAAAVVPPRAQIAVGTLTFGACSLMALHLIVRLRRQLAERPPLYLNPFL